MIWQVLNEQKNISESNKNLLIGIDKTVAILLKTVENQNDRVLKLESWQSDVERRVNVELNKAKEEHGQIYKKIDENQLQIIERLDKTYDTLLVDVNVKDEQRKKEIAENMKYINYALGGIGVITFLLGLKALGFW